MKKLKQSIQLLWFNLLNFFKIRKFKKFENQLEKGVKEQQVEKAILILDIKDFLKKNTKYGRSKYIPLNLKTRIEIKTMILFEFGQKMSKLNVKINNNLQLSY